jgi:hypothetical protein
VRLFGRRESLNERLLREAGMSDPGREDNRAPWDNAGIHGVSRPREWDEVVSVEADLDGTAASFVVLDDTIVIDDGPDDVEPLANAVTLPPPYRAEARKVGERVWSVGARRVEVVELPGLAGDRLEYVSRDGFTSLDVDGSHVLASFPQLAREGDYVIRGTLLEGNLWEVESAAL